MVMAGELEGAVGTAVLTLPESGLQITPRIHTIINVPTTITVRWLKYFLARKNLAAKVFR